LSKSSPHSNSRWWALLGPDFLYAWILLRKTWKNVFNYFIYKMVPSSKKSTMSIAKSKTEK
jgi:hypothetical protein